MITLTFAEVLDAAGVTDPDGLITDLRTVCGINAADCIFEPVTVPMPALEGWGSDAEAYLLDGDEEGYEKVIGLTDAFMDQEDVPGIVIGPDLYDPEDMQVLDGMHRIGAARQAGVKKMTAYRAIRQP